MTLALLLPFAKRLSDGLLVTPEEVPRGLACNCFVHAVNIRYRLGRELRKSGISRMQKPGRVLALMKSQCTNWRNSLFASEKELLLPALDVVVSARGDFGEILNKQEVVFESKAVRLDDCKVGRRLEEITPDICGSRKGRQILVEVTVFHRLMPEKRKRLIDTGLASFEIDLSIFKTQQASRALVEDAVFRQPGNRRWIYHPRTIEVEATLRGRLEKRLEEARIAWEQSELKRKTQEAEWSKNRLALAAFGNVSSIHSSIHSLIHETELQPASEPGWKASFPAPELLQPARKAFCLRLGLPETQVDEVMSNMTKRSHLATTSPVELSKIWSEALGVSTDEIFRYFREAGYIIDYDADF